jgi:hypothetical protein
MTRLPFELQAVLWHFAPASLKNVTKSVMPYALSDNFAQAPGGKNS